MRFKKRFLYVKASGEKLSVAEGRRLFTIEIEKMDDKEVSLKHFDEPKQEGVVKCPPKSLEKAEKAFSKTVSFEGRKIALKVRKVSPSFALRVYKETIK